VPRVAHEYLGFAVGCLTIIFVSLAYYAMVLVVELTMAICPDTLTPMLACLCPCAARGANAAAAATAARAKRTSVTSDAEGMSSDMVVNPVLLRASAMAEAGAAASDPALAGIVALAEVLRAGSPSPALWAAVQGSYGKMTNMLHDLLEESRATKRAQQVAADTAELASAMEEAMVAGARARRPLVRHQFQPRVTAGGDEAAAGGARDSPRSRGGGVASSSVFVASNPMSMPPRTGTSARVTAGGGGTGLSLRQLPRGGGGAGSAARLRSPLAVATVASASPLSPASSTPPSSSAGSLTAALLRGTAGDDAASPPSLSPGVPFAAADAMELPAKGGDLPAASTPLDAAAAPAPSPSPSPSPSPAGDDPARPDAAAGAP